MDLRPRGRLAVSLASGLMARVSLRVFARRIYARDYRARNPERIRAISRRYLERNREAIRARQAARVDQRRVYERQYRALNPTVQRERQRRYRERNREALRVKNRERMRVARVRDAG